MASPITTRLLRFNHRYKTTTLHHFSTTIPTNPLPQPEPESKPNSPFTDYIKSTLHNQQQPPRTQLYQQNQNPISHNQQTNHFPQRNQQPNFLNQPRTDFSFRNQSIDDISQSEPFRKVYQNLSQFSSRTAQPPPSSKQQVSFSNLFKQSTQNAIKPNDFRSRFKDNLNTPSNGAPGGGFGSSGMGFNMGLGFTRKPEELGRKLRELRPEKRMGEWFSLQELSDRLVKLKEIEEKEKTGVGYDLRNVMITLRDNKAEEEKMKRRIVQKLDTLGNIGGTPSYMLHPPKEDLLEQYFHPDNMSSAEKMKLELKKVRDEFKMSDSDCGSARVQVAQLTTKIKHLSTVLAKKDKHSRKGLQAMVQKRKKLLKYLRRTDWDSYSLVLSKLGLRDNPDIKA